MEDRTQVKFGTTPIQYLFLAVFDGHGGVEAAEFAKEHLFAEISAQESFWSNDVDQVKKGMRDGFVSTHNKMLQVVGKKA